MDIKNIIRQRGGLVDPVKDSQINQNILHKLIIELNKSFENDDSKKQNDDRKTTNILLALMFEPLL